MAMAGQGVSATQPKLQSLLEDGARLTDRLAKVLHNLEQVNDKLNGSSPRDASVDPPEPQPSARRQMDRSHALLSVIEDEIQRIDARL